MLTHLDGTLAFTLATFFLAGFVKGVIGLGLPTIAIGLLSIVMAPAQAAALLIVPSFLTNLWQMVGPGVVGIARRLATMLIGVCVGTYLGSGLILGAGGGRASVALGLALVAYAAVGLTGVKLTVARHCEPWLSPIVGVVTGAITGATGVFVIPAVPYLQALGLEKDELVQALGLSFLVSTLALGVSLSTGGGLGGGLVATSFLALAPALAGMAVGQAVRTRISPARFRRWFFVGLLLLGGHLALRGLA
jgi:hypothetical protein